MAGTWKSSLSRYEIPRELFNKILFTYPASVEKVDNIYEYFKGYSSCHKIRFNKEYLICTNEMLAYADPDFKYNKHPTAQIICRINDSIDEPTYIKSKSGLDYYNDLFVKCIGKIYPNYIEIFKMYNTEYNESKAQLHRFIQTEFNKVIKFKDCHYYDLNGAYCYELCAIFPKAKDKLIELYNLKKDKPQLKNLYCYAVGYLVRKGYTGLYNYIVQRVRYKIDNAIEEVNGTLVQANTDGFVISSPSYLLETTKALGGWKQEYEGDCYVYRNDLPGTTPYDVIQLGKDIKGTCRRVAVKGMDLSKGIINTYIIQREYIQYNVELGLNIPIINKNFIMVVKNIKKEKVEVCLEDM